MNEPTTQQIPHFFASATVANIGTAFCLLILIATVGRLILKYFGLDKAGRTDYIASFKKGKCFFIYFAAIPMFLIGLLYGEPSLSVKIFIADLMKALASSAQLIGLKFEFNSINTLFNNNPFYAVTVLLCYFLVILNAAMFLLSLFQRSRFQSRVLRDWKKAGHKVLIVGYNQNNTDILKSAKNGEMCVIRAPLTEEEEKQLYVNNIPFFNAATPSKRKTACTTPAEMVCAAIEDNKIRLSKEQKNPETTYCIIINTESDEENLSVCRKLCETLNQYTDSILPVSPPSSTEEEKNEKKQERTVGLLSHIQIYVFGNSRFEALYHEIVDKSKGVIRYLNKYTQIAIDFIQKYPLTQFMTEEQLDTENFRLREEANVHVLFFGFGKTNQQIFLTSVANNQFIDVRSNGDGSTVETIRPVKYHIFDKEESENDKNLNHNYYRYRNEFFRDEIVDLLRKTSLCGKKTSGDYCYGVQYPYTEKVISGDKNPEDYLPLTMLPAEEYYHHLDINDTRFYNTVKSILSAGKKDIHYILIAFGSDMENADLARKLVEKRKEWGLKNIYIFVKIRSGISYSDIFDEPDCFLIGDEKNIVYNLANIQCSEMMQLALKRNHVYESENTQSEDYIHNQYGWYVKKTQIERDSNFYAVLSLRSKLHMMGLDYVDYTAPGTEITSEEYYEIYGKEDMPRMIMTGKLDYPKDPSDFNCTSPRHSMAVQEHYRWNSYMITQGIVPSTVAQIKDNGGKDYKSRRHGNLTTFAGLIDFYKMRGYDVIKYDYELLDCAVSFLQEVKTPDGKRKYKIIKKNNGN